MQERVSLEWRPECWERRSRFSTCFPAIAPRGATYFPPLHRVGPLPAIAPSGATFQIHHGGRLTKMAPPSNWTIISTPLPIDSYSTHFTTFWSCDTSSLIVQPPALNERCRWTKLGGGLHRWCPSATNFVPLIDSHIRSHITYQCDINIIHDHCLFIIMILSWLSRGSVESYGSRGDEIIGAASGKVYGGELP